MIVATYSIGGPILLMLVLIHQELKRMNDRAEKVDTQQIRTEQ